MNSIIECNTGNLFRNDEFAPSSLYGSFSPESGKGHEQKAPNISSKDQQGEPLSKEREEELENWMTEIKTFIRSIDVNNL